MSSIQLTRELKQIGKLTDAANANSDATLPPTLKSRRSQRSANLQDNAKCVTNTCLLYFLSTFLWIFRRFLRQFLREEKLNLAKDAGDLRQSCGIGAGADNCRRQRAAVKIAAAKDKMSASAASSSSSPPSSPSASSSAAAAESAKLATNPCRSVTLKARVANMEQMEAALFDLTDTIGHVTAQEDVFFNVPYGQMKLRTSRSAGKDKGQLISYKQTNNTGPNFSESRVTQVSDAPYLRTTLALSLTELGTIAKKRRIYEKENVQICLDDVLGLGCFVDIDIRCDGSENQSAEKLLKQIEKIKKTLKIEADQLVPYSYFELMMRQQQTQQQQIDNNNGHRNGGERNNDNASNNNNYSNNNNGDDNNGERNNNNYGNNNNNGEDAESGISEGGSSSSCLS